MGRENRKSGKYAKERENLRKARERLSELSNETEETDEYLRRNSEVIKAEQALPFLRRW